MNIGNYIPLTYFKWDSNKFIWDIAAKNILEMLETSSIKCFSGKKIKCEIDTICIHGDGLNALSIVEELKKQLLKEKFKLLPLNKLSKFI